jgi:NitT/TauT family transport system substrate-binding protein
MILNQQVKYSITVGFKGFCVLLFVAVLISCDTTVDPLRYASGPILIETPAHVAFKTGIFEKENLNVDLVIHPDGKSAFESLLDGQADVASVMATPVVYERFSGDDFRIIAAIRHSKFHSLIASRMAGVKRPEDIKGKTAGVTKGTSGEYFMQSYLVSKGIFPEEVDVVHMSGPELPRALKEGVIDVMFSWKPFIGEAKRLLGKDAISFSSSRLVQPSWLIITTEPYINQHQDVLIRFLLSIRKGIEFIEEDPEAAIAMHREVIDIDNGSVARDLTRMNLGLSLSQELLVDLENQAQWLQKMNYVDADTLPDFYSVIYPDVLEQVSPGSVTLIKE